MTTQAQVSSVLVNGIGLGVHLVTRGIGTKH
jgi:hypothetical protein